MPKSNKTGEFNSPVMPESVKEDDSKSPSIFAAAQNELGALEQSIAIPGIELPIAAKPAAGVIPRGLINQYLMLLCRIMLSVLISFELLNLLGILKYSISFPWLGLFFTTGGAWFILELIFSYTQITNPAISSTLMLAAVLGIYADAVGNIFHLFDKVGWYDQLLHFFAGGIITSSIIFLILKTLEHQGKIKIGIYGLAFFAWMTTVFLGVLYELGEYAADYFTGSNSLVSAFDTANDLLLDTLGSLFIVGICAIYLYRKSLKNRKTVNV